MSKLQSKSIAIQACSLGKCYKIYDEPRARLKQALLRGRKQYFREFWALRNIDFEVKKGESVAIIGRNGSGKSTLLQMICGTLTPTEGSVKTYGTIAALLELGSGFNPEFTGIENVYLNASLLGLSNKQIESRLDDIQSFADIGGFINQPVKTYSSGMLVRLAFAVIAHVEPAILVVDEALSVGDAVFGQRCMRFIRRFKETGTLLFVSHDLNSVSSLCDRALWIESGRLRLDSTNANIVRAYTRHCLETSKANVKQTENRHEQSTPEHICQKEASKKLNGKMVNPRGNYIPLKREQDKSLQINSKPSNQDIANWDKTTSYGNRHAIITEVSLTDSQGIETFNPICGEHVSLTINTKCLKEVANFMSGYIVRDKTGMIVWGENSIGEELLNFQPGDVVKITYAFTMPFLRAGTYSISVALSENDIDMPTVMHYKLDALSIEPILGTRPVHGIFALPSIHISTVLNP